jgi:hypothetical protein
VNIPGLGGRRGFGGLSARRFPDLGASRSKAYLFVDPVGGNDNNSGASWSKAIAGGSVALAAKIKPGMTVTVKSGTTLRAVLPSASGVSYVCTGATILGSEALPVGSATLVSGTKYKIATSLHRPNTGGTTATNSIYLYTNGVGYNGTDDPTPVPKNATNSASVGTNEWSMPGDGFLYFDLGRAVTADDVFEMPQRNGASIEHSGMRILGGTWRHAEGKTILIGSVNQISGAEVGHIDAAWASDDGVNVKGTAGGCTGIYIHDSTFHDLQYDGGGGGDGISFENATPGNSGLIERCNFIRCGKTALGMSDSNVVRYHDLYCDASSIAIAGSGTQAGSHVFTRIRMVNEWPQVATNVHYFYVFPLCHAATVVDINGLSVYRGTGTTASLRAVRLQSGDCRIHNVVVEGVGASTTMGAGFMQSGDTFTESNCAAHGCDANFFGTWPGTNDLTLSGAPFTNAAAGDLTPTSQIAGKGVGGVDIGYTAVPALPAPG